MWSYSTNYDLRGFPGFNYITTARLEKVAGPGAFRYLPIPESINNATINTLSCQVNKMAA